MVSDLHRRVALDGVGFSHQVLAVLGWSHWTIEVIVNPAQSAASVYNQAYQKIRNRTKSQTNQRNNIVRIIIRHKGEIVSDREYSRFTSNLIIYVTPIITKYMNMAVKLKSKVLNKFKVRIK